MGGRGPGGWRATKGRGKGEYMGEAWGTFSARWGDVGPATPALHALRSWHWAPSTSVNPEAPFELIRPHST